MGWIKTTTKVVIGVSIFALLIWVVGWREILDTLARINPAIFLPIFVLYAIILLATGFSFWFFLPKIEPLRMMKISIISWGLGTLTPAKLGHLSILYFLKKRGVPLVRGGAIFTVDRIVGLVISFIFFISGFLFFFPLQSFFLYLLLFIGATFCLLFFFFHPFGRRIIQTLLIGSFVDYFHGFTAEIRGILSSQRRAIIISASFKVLLTMASASVFWIILNSLGAEVSIWMVAFVFSANTFINLVPITLDGLGLRESVAVILYSQVGIEATTVISTYFVVRLLNYISAGLIIVIFSDLVLRIRKDLPGMLRRKKS